MFHRHDGGKGDKPILPQDKEKYDNNWDAIFKKTPQEVDDQKAEDEAFQEIQRKQDNPIK